MVVDYICKKAPSQQFDNVLNTPLQVFYRIPTVKNFSQNAKRSVFHKVVKSLHEVNVYCHF